MTVIRTYDAAGSGFQMDSATSNGILLDDGSPAPDVTLLSNTGSELSFEVTSPFPFRYFTVGYSLAYPNITIGYINAYDQNHAIALSVGSIDLTISLTDSPLAIPLLTGNDSITGNKYNDRIYAGPGADQIYGAAGADRLHGNNGNDLIHAGSGADRLFGEGDNDVLYGEGGSDILNGGGGQDMLLGGGGNDTLLGLGGADTLSGGKGKDVFKYATAKQGNDQITDFHRAQSDKIQVVSKNFHKLAKGTLASGRFTANASGIAKDANDYFVFNTTTHTLYYDKDGSGSGAAVKLATFTNGANLRHTDIVVV